MTPSIQGYVGGSNPLQPTSADLAAFVDGVIQEDLISLVVVRSGTAQAAQDVRVMGHSKPIEVISPGGKVLQMTASVLGYKDHPVITDTDIQYDDTFLFEDARHRVVDIAVSTGGYVFAYCAAMR